VFFPLERHRLPRLGQQINILLVFLLTGLWHGFQTTFIVWGLLHGLAIAVESLGLGQRLKRAWLPLRYLYTWAVVLVGWVFFRSTSFNFALDFLGRLAGNTRDLQVLPFVQTKPLPFVEPSFVIVLIVALVLALPIGAWWQHIRARWQAGRPALALGLQVLEDSSLLGLFFLSMAAILSSQFLPNLYAKF
jgi:alginate O-acetyltransferase complex protein AlgI